MKVLVTGGVRYSDLKRLQRALDALHTKHHIECLVLDERGGASEMAYFWAIQRRITEIITAPAKVELLTQRMNRSRHHLELLQRYTPDAVVTFSYPQQEPIAALAKQHGIQVWDVPPTFR